jgi:hypothetical protein
MPLALLVDQILYNRIAKANAWNSALSVWGWGRRNRKGGGGGREERVRREREEEGGVKEFRGNGGM